MKSADRYASAERGNFARYIAMEILNAFTYLFMGGTLWQGLLLHNHCSQAMIGTLAAVGSIAQAVAMGLNTVIADRFKKPIRMIAIGSLPILLVFVVISALCFVGERSFLFPILLAAVILYYAAYGFRATFSYKIPYLTIKMEHYGRLTAVVGLVSNLFCIVVSAGIPFFLEKVDYMKGMLLLYIVCAVFVGTASILSLRMKIINEMPASSARPTLRELLSDKSVTHLAPANFLRGVAVGVITSLTLVAAELYELDSVALSTLVSLTTLGSVLGNFLYTVLGKANFLSILCLISSVTLLVFGPMAALSSSWTVFMVLFTILQIAYIIVSGTIPVMLAKITPYRIIGGCTSLRMMVTMAGTALSGWLAGLVLEHTEGVLPSVILLLVAGLSQFYCGIAYHIFYHKAQKE